MLKPSKHLFFILFFAKLAFGQSEVHLRVETNTFTRIPVELKDCTTRSQASVMDAKKVLEILDNDLWMSSVIASFRSDEQLGDANSPWLELASRGPTEPFRLAVHPQVEITGNALTLAAKLIDSRSGALLADKSYRGCRENLRVLVHGLADDIVNVLTGQSGISQSRIVFSSEASRAKELFVMDYDGTNIRQLTSNGSLNLTPAWSPDGLSLAMTSYQASGPDIFLLDAVSGKTVFHLNKAELQTAPAWSPDGKSLAFSSSHEGNSEIYVLNVSTKKIQRLTIHPAVDSSPSWSPTGRELVFTSDRLGRPQLFVMDAEGGNLRRLTYYGEYNDSPAWSPRGDKIAYVSRVEGRFNILTMEVTGENVSQLTTSGSNEDPCWSPDGNRIVFSSLRNGQRDLYSMEWNGENLRRLTHRGTCSSPSWSSNARPETTRECK